MIHIAVYVMLINYFNLKNNIFDIFFRTKIFLPKRLQGEHTKKNSIGRHLKFECGIQPMFECLICYKKFALKENTKKYLIQKHII